MGNPSSTNHGLRRKGLGFVLATLILGASPGAISAEPGVVDLFSTAQAVQTNTVGGTAFNQAGNADDSSILGGFRDLFVGLVRKDAATPSINRVSMVVGADVLAFNNDPGVKGYGEVVWDGSAAYTVAGAYNVTGLGGIDLTEGGTKGAFAIETISADANWNFEVVAYTGATRWTRINFLATERPSGTPGTETTEIPFAGFTDASNCGAVNPAPGVNRITCGSSGPVDFANLGALVLRLNVGTDGNPAGGVFDIDLRVASITTVPKFARLGDRVWEDLNGNGLQDVGEPNIDNAEVELFKFGGGVCGDGNETFVGSQFTSSMPDPSGAGGNYLFPNLEPGQYCVQFIAPQICNGAPATFTKQNVGMNDAIDSDADPATGWTAPITLVAGQTDLTVDAGFYCPASVGDFVWNDLNEDGIQDTGEPGIDGVKVDLLTCDGTFVATTTTGTNGDYLFSGLAPGSYFVKFQRPDGFVFSPLNVGDAAFDSDAQSNGQTSCFDLASGETNLTIDAGLYEPVQANAQLGDFVWHDLNADGIQNAGEPGIAGAAVELFSCPAEGEGTLLATTTTNANGLYLFANLLPGDYYVQFAKPDGFLFASPVLQGSNPALDSDADPTTGRTQCVALAEGESNLTLDAGFYNPAALGDFVWNDENRNGIQDEGEPGISGVRVELFECGSDVVKATTTTGVNGGYLFDGLMPGSYYVRFEAPDGFEFTLLNVGTDITVDSDAESNGQTACVTLQSGDFNDTIDAGLYMPATAQLGDFVWHDLNADGIQQSGEPGIAGATVELFMCNGMDPIATQTTNSNGLYLFDNLAAGSYQVKFTRPAGFEFGSPSLVGDPKFDSNADPMTGLTACIDLAQGESNLTIDAGFYKSAALGDFVWNDQNQNGIQDMGEPGIPGVVVNLYTCEGVFLDDTTTDGNGIYSFTGLMPGSYYVLFEAPMDFVFSPQFQGGDPAKDSNADPETGATPCVTLISGQTDNTIDAGLYERMMNPGTGTPGYWKNHPEAWPVDQITIGSVIYTKSEAIAEMWKPGRGDTTRIMFPALVSAKLNVIIGNDASCIAATIAAADTWMATYGPVGSRVRANSEAWKIGEPLYKLLDDYNNGRLCAPSRG